MYSSEIFLVFPLTAVNLSAKLFLPYQERKIHRYRKDALAKIKSGCPSFKKGWDINESACQNCHRHFKQEYKACRKAVLRRRYGNLSAADLGEVDKNSRKKEEIKAIRAKRKPNRNQRAANMLKYGGFTLDEIVLTLIKEFDIKNKKPLEYVRKRIGQSIRFMRYAGCIFEDDKHRLWVQPNKWKFCYKCRKHEGQVEMEYGRHYCIWCAEKEMEDERK